MPIDKIVRETVTEVENIDYWVNYLTELGETYLPKVAPFVGIIGFGIV
ncbi:MAG: hypothetical protein QMC68_07120 [Bacteroidia bacterium]|jgi:hypothetical protein|tara:strand:- start:118 stop:261 length:144 start_codon:yes stop_codon:yes gene_type:complete